MQRTPTTFCCRARERARVVAIIAVVAALCLAHSLLSSAHASSDPLTGQAWQLADEAYKAFDRRDYANAIAKAREAIALRPDSAQLRHLLVNTLAAQGDIAGAAEEAQRAIAENAADDELKEQSETLRREFARNQQSDKVKKAYEAAAAGYVAYAHRDFKKAAANAREANELDPSRKNYASLLVDALRGSGHLKQAKQEANVALKRFPNDGELRLQRGYILQSLGQSSAAMADFKFAADSQSITETQRRSARLSLVDLLLAAHRPQEALKFLGPLHRRHDYDIAIRRGYALQQLGRMNDALTAFVAAQKAATDRTQRTASLRGRLSALVALKRTDEARTLFDRAYRAGEFRGVAKVDLAYLAGQIGEPKRAFQFFQEADVQGKLKGSALIDAGYAARGQFDNAEAERFLRRTIDAHFEGALPLEAQRLFEIRRDVANISRTWGMTNSLIYGAVGVIPGIPTTLPSAGRTLQSGTEIYWRPSEIGYLNGATFDIFGRAFTTLYDRTGGATGADTTQGSAGVRWKPFSDINLVLEAGRLFPLGRYAREDWQLRVGYSLSEGGDLRRDKDNWRYWQIYAEASQFLQTNQTLATFEARFGQSFRLDSVSPNLVISPFVAVGAAYDSTLATPGAVGAGLGTNLRFWFREDRYRAPMSYLDVSLQYRVRLAGDKRAEGWFGLISVAY